jgi:hypothetical protein
MKMLNEHNFLLFIFIFSILTTLKLIIKFISALLQNPPQKLELTGRELIFYGLMFSYLLTYIITD